MGRRQEEIAAGVRVGPRVATRKDRVAYWRGTFAGSTKQRYKHAARRSVRASLRQARHREAVLALLRAATASCPVEVTSIAFIGSSVPYVGYGKVTTGAGRELVWTFRFRYDRAFLEVGTPADEGDDVIGECELAASRDDVTGQPYAGWLPDDDAVALLAELFARLAPPRRGVRFGERLANTVALVSGVGDVSAPSLLR